MLILKAMNYKNLSKEELIEMVESLESKVSKMEKRSFFPDLDDSEVANLTLKAAPIGIGHVKDRIIGWTNDVIQSMLGYSGEELFGKDARILYPSEEEYLRVGKIKHPQIEKSGIGQIETKLITKNKKILDVILSSAAFDKNDLSKGLIFTVQDITPLKKYQKALEESEDKFRTLYENSPLPYQSLDEQGNIKTVNEAWCREMGYDKNEVIGRNFAEFIDIEYYNFFKKNFPKFKKVGHVLGAEFEMIRKNGDELIAKFDGKIGKNDDGSFRQTHCTFVNITEKKKFEGALIKSDKEKNMILESVNESVTYLDTEYNVVWGNQAPAVRRSNTMDKVQSRKCYEGWHDRTEPCEGCPVTKTLQTGKKANSVLKTSQDSYDSIHTYPVKDDDGKMIGVVEVVRDISKRMHAEVQLQKLNQDLESIVATRTQQLADANEELKIEIEERKRIENELVLANNSKDKLFHIIAHDLKNPLQALLLSTDLLLRKRDQLNIPDLTKKHQQMYDTTRFITKLLENLLEWSKAQHGNIEYNPEKLNLLEIAKSEILRFQNIASDWNIELKLEFKDDIIVLADLKMVTTIFRNLISNSLKYTQENGLISINASRNPMHAEIEISDSGLGIPESKINDIFKIDKATTTPGIRKEKGTGFGLILCKEFIEKHNGFIRIDSEVNKGTKITFSLPLAE
jgi:PAS domain S-box-containing protein